MNKNFFEEIINENREELIKSVMDFRYDTHYKYRKLNNLMKHYDESMNSFVFVADNYTQLQRNQIYKIFLHFITYAINKKLDLEYKVYGRMIPRCIPSSKVDVSEGKRLILGYQTGRDANKLKYLKLYFKDENNVCYNNNVKIKTVIKLSQDKEAGTGLYLEEKQYVLVNGKEYNMEDVYVISEITPHQNYVPFREQLYDNGDKISISKITKTYFVNPIIDKICEVTYVDRFTMNCVTGRSYMFPTINSNTGYKHAKYKDEIKIMRQVTVHSNNLYSMNISEETILKAMKLINEKNPDFIPYEKYIEKEKIRREKYKYLYNEISIKTLIGYNACGKIPYDKYYGATSILNDKHFKMGKKIKRIRNENILKDIQNQLNKYLKKVNINTKLFYKAYGNYDLSYSVFDVMDTLLQINKNVTDINNIYKLIKASKERQASLYDFSRFVNGKFYEDAVNQYGENKVINRIIDNIKIIPAAKEKMSIDTFIEEPMYIRPNENNTFSNKISGEMLYDIENDYRMLKRYVNVKIPKKFNLRTLHDIYAKESRILIKTQYEYEYNKELYDFNTDITIDSDVYQFRLANNSHKLVEIGNAMNICVGSYGDRVAEGYSLIVYVTKDNDYKACLELAPKSNSIVQIKAHHNEQAEGTLIKAVAEFCNMFNIYNDSYYDVKEEYESLFTGKGKSKQLSKYEVDAIPENKEEVIAKLQCTALI